MNLHKCHLLAKVNTSAPLCTHPIHTLNWKNTTRRNLLSMELIHRLLSRKYAGFFFSFWGQTLRGREANKVIKSNQKFRSLTPELTAEAPNTLINSCCAVNGGLSETFQRPCCVRILENLSYAAAVWLVFKFHRSIEGLELKLLTWREAFDQLDATQDHPSVALAPHAALQDHPSLVCLPSLKPCADLRPLVLISHTIPS